MVVFVKIGSFLSKLGIFVKIGHVCQNWAFLSTLGVCVKIGHFCQIWAFLSKLGMFVKIVNFCIKKGRFCHNFLLLLSKLGKQI